MRDGRFNGRPPDAEHERDERDEHGIREREVRELRDLRRIQQEVQEPERDLRHHEAEEPARRDSHVNHRIGEARRGEVREHGCAEQREHRVEHAELDEEVRVRVEVRDEPGAERSRGEERVPECRDGAARADEDEERETARQQAERTGRRRPLDASPLRERRRAREESEGVGEMDRHHVCPEHGGVVADETQANQGSSQKALHHHEPEQHRGMTAREVPGRRRPPREREESEGEEPTRRRGHSVQEFDGRVMIGDGRNEAPLAERPVIAAAIAREADPHVRAPDDDEHEITDVEVCELPEAHEPGGRFDHRRKRSRAPSGEQADRGRDRPFLRSAAAGVALHQRVVADGAAAALARLGGVVVRGVVEASTVFSGRPRGTTLTCARDPLTSYLGVVLDARANREDGILARSLRAAGAVESPEDASELRRAVQGRSLLVDDGTATYLLTPAVAMRLAVGRDATIEGEWVVGRFAVSAAALADALVGDVVLEDLTASEPHVAFASGRRGGRVLRHESTRGEALAVQTSTDPSHLRVVGGHVRLSAGAAAAFLAGEPVDVTWQPTPWVEFHVGPRLLGFGRRVAAGSHHGFELVGERPA